MPTLGSEELALLRVHPHRIKEYLAVMQPATILAGRLNGAPAGDPVVQINYTWTGGDHDHVVAGMTLWIGTSERGKDKGMCRVRKAPTESILYIGEDSSIDWENGDYLTVVEDWQLWVKYPRIVANGGLNIWKDWEIPYDQQHHYWEPVAVLGPPDAQFIAPDTGLATCQFVGERSYAVAPAANIIDHDWSFPGGTPSSSSDPGTEESPIEVTWDTPGIYWVTLTVEDSNHQTHTGRRPVFIFNRTGEGTPITRFKMTGRRGSLDQHGHSASFEVYGDADQEQFPDGAMVVYFTEDWYGDTKKSIGGNFPYRAHIKFVGYIQKESTTKDPQTSVVTFEAATIHSLMSSREGFSCWIKEGSSASTWTQATNLTADRAALDLCRYHSTLLDICDVIPSGSTLRIKSQEFAAKTTLLQQLQDLYDDLFAYIACDKQGRVYFEIDPQMRPVTERGTIPIVADLTQGDWQDKINLPRPQESKISFINLAGVYYPGHPYPVVPILSKAPGDTPAYEGSTREISGLILGGQSDGNEKAGLALAYDNNEFPDVPIPMTGLWDVFDIVPQEYVRLSLAASDTKRGIVWTNQKLIPRQVELNMEETEAGRVPKVDITVEKDSYGPAGVDGDYPDDVPTLPVNPPTPPPPIPPPGGYKGEAGPVVASHDEDGCYWSDFMGQSWEARNTGLPSTAILDLIWDPWWFTAERAGNRDPENAILWACGEGFIAKSINAGLGWEEITPTEDPPNTWNDTTPPTAGMVTYKQIHGDIYHIDTFYVLVEWQEVDSGTGKWRGWIAKTIDNGLTWAWYNIPPVGTGYEVLRTSMEPPYNVLEIGDSHDFGTTDPESGFYVDDHHHFYFTLLASYGEATVSFEYYSALPTGWYVSAWSLEYCPYCYSTLGGTGGAWFSFSRVCSGCGVPPGQKYLRASPAGGNNWWIRKVSVSVDQFVIGELRPLAMDVDTESGTRVYVTTWTDGTLYVSQRDAGDLSFLKASILGLATKEQVADKTYFVVPRCPFVLGGSGFGEYLWIFGRWNDGVDKHLAYSDDGGATLIDKGAASWGAAHRVGAIEVLYDNTVLYAIVNHTTTPRLWISPDAGIVWNDIDDVPFNVEFEALTRCTWAADELFIGANTAGAMMAAWLPSPYSDPWTDGTGDPSLPTLSGAISSIIWVG